MGDPLKVEGSGMSEKMHPLDRGILIFLGVVICVGFMCCTAIRIAETQAPTPPDAEEGEDD